MLVSFLGSPCSGKSTTACLLAGKLKAGGYPVEFYSEYARMYIAKKRLECERDGLMFSLNDEDQFAIMERQMTMEATLDESLKKVGGLTVTDTSALNALLYLNQPADGGIPSTWTRPNVVKMVEAIKARTGIFFFSFPVDLPEYVRGTDPNRVHDQKQSEAIHALVSKLKNHFGLDSVIPLVGNEDNRLSKAHAAVMGRLPYLTQTKEL